MKFTKYSIIYILFFLLLAWPLYIFLSYMMLGADVRSIVVSLIIGLEIILGAGAVFFTIRRRKERSKGKFIALLSVVSVAYLGYLISLATVYLF